MNFPLIGGNNEMLAQKIGRRVAKEGWINNLVMMKILW